VTKKFEKIKKKFRRKKRPTFFNLRQTLPFFFGGGGEILKTGLGQYGKCWPKLFFLRTIKTQ
jgi:hypothetical protein